ncbi:MAG: glycosyltransferase family 2 protein [Gammaproteobacteria bacterium]|nr:glycosyltransferase family 2 protein [Gammaproteobacteria bacterium]
MAPADSAAAGMKLSIITVNYRSWDHLESSLLELHRDFPDDWEVIVVDNESESRPFDDFSARFPWVRFIANASNSGFGAGCNIGVEAATGRQLLFMNPDVIASTRSIEALIDIKAQHNIGIIAPQQLGSSGKPQKVFDDFPNLLNQSKMLKSLLRILMPSRFPNPRADYRDLTYCNWVTGSVVLIDRADFDAIGGWSEDYWMYAEDADLCRKAHDKGLTVAYAPQVQVVHAHGGSSRINVAVKSMTKLEVIISKHVYTARHTAGLERWLTHALIIVLRLPMLVLASILDWITLRRIAGLRVRSGMLAGLSKYYIGVLRNHTWLSPRAIANQASPNVRIAAG